MKGVASQHLTFVFRNFKVPYKKIKKQGAKAHPKNRHVKAQEMSNVETRPRLFAQW